MPASPKPKRIVDEECLKRIRAIGHCERCGRRDIRLEVSHTKSRGSGGFDSDENCTLLCFICHRLHHDGHVSRDELYAIAAARIERQKAMISFGSINCPACFQKVGIVDEGGCLTCSNCSAVLLRYSSTSGGA